MKKMYKTSKFLELAIAITLVLASLLPGAVFATIPTLDNSTNTYITDNIMMVENTSAVPGATNHVIRISGSWDINLAAYTMAINYDLTKIKIVNISLESTVADFPDSGWKVFWAFNESDPSIAKAGALTFSTDFIPPGSGALFNVVVNISENVTIGETYLDLFNDFEADPPLECVFVDNVTNYLYPQLIDGVLDIQVHCGDANGDGTISISDVVYIINYLFRGGNPPVPWTCVGDANGDKQTSISDVVYLISYLFRGGNPPVDNCCD